MAARQHSGAAAPGLATPEGLKTDETRGLGSGAGFGGQTESDKPDSLAIDAAGKALQRSVSPTHILLLAGLVHEPISRVDENRNAGAFSGLNEIQASGTVYRMSISCPSEWCVDLTDLGGQRGECGIYSLASTDKRVAAHHSSEEGAA